MAEKTDKKILIVEDDPNFVAILKQKFDSEGFVAITAQDGKEGLSAFDREKPDLVISDVLLPMDNGVDMVKKIKEKNPDVPVILLTNIKDESYTDIIKKLKKTDYLIKSDIRLDDIVKIAKRRLGVIHR
ncbi:MAG: response regulator [Candidatus Staskawiczbacteria bacterium]|nr:response regulator [Candidatus Staskawiczbacteria bacterium]